MSTKVFQCPIKIKVLLISYLLLIASLVATFFIIHDNQKAFFAKEIKYNKLILNDISNNSFILGKLGNKSPEYKGPEKQQSTKVEQNRAEQQVSSTLLNHPETNGDLDATRPKIALIVAGLGLNKIATLGALDMDNRIALGFSPYGNDVADWVSQGRIKGYEVFMNIPMQPAYPNNDPGPFALLAGLSLEDNLSRLALVMKKSNKTLGLYSDAEEIFTNSKSDILPVFKVLKQNNIAFIYGGDANNGILEDLSESLGLNYINNNIVIDEELNLEEAKSNLLRLENMAKVRGFAVGKFHAYPMSIKLINEWVKELKTRDIVLVPITHLFDLKKESIKERSKSSSLAFSNNIISSNKDKNPESEFLVNKEDIEKKELLKGKMYTKEEYKKYFNNPDNIVLSSEKVEQPQPANKEASGEQEAN